MKSLHDFNSVIITTLLGRVKDHYSIPIEYELYTHRSGQWAHDPFLDGFGLTLNALEAGLKFSLHTVIEACLSWWRILPSKMAPNSWRYMVAFFRECRGVGITSTRSLFLSCFHLLKGPGSYFLSSYGGFKVSRAPSNNKGWKSYYFFVSCSRGWRFSLRWSARVINNSCLGLSNDEYERLKRLTEILSTSRAVRDMTKEWLVEASLSPTPRDMVNLKPTRGMPCASSAPRPHQHGAPFVGDSNWLGNSKPDCPCKKPKIGTSKLFESVTARVSVTKAGSIPRDWSHGSTPNEAAGSGHNKEHARKAGSAKAIRPALMCDLCCTRARTKNEHIQALFMG
ncbi:hypothetical protein C4D60_Mb04t22860 [Musa balbisiana]|uniref:Uncharacterized protein n=1 Tax=Musa balbisiana TaxID=52838 RepID=A0A4S8KE33_MUSBA|nr:hypothetical protein C4D60_Mb04t22860 [Musa balbisiana]